MKKILITCLIFLLFPIFEGNAQDSRLDDYLITAARNNPGLKAQFAAYRATLEEIPQAGALPDPQVMFGYLIEPVQTRLGPQQARIGISQSFPWFGSLKAGKDAASSMAEANLENFRQAKSKLYYDIKSTWYDLYVVNKAIGRTKENLAILNTFRQVALSKISAGLASSVDEIRLQMETGDLENQLALLKDKEHTLNVMFNNLLNTGPETPVDAPDTLDAGKLDMDPSETWDSISVQNHQVRQMEHLIESMGSPGNCS